MATQLKAHAATSVCLIFPLILTIDNILATGLAPVAAAPRRALCTTKLFLFRSGGATVAFVGTEMLLIRYLYAFYWRHVGVPNDDFFGAFLATLNPTLILYFAILGTALSNANKVPAYAACLGISGQGQDPYAQVMFGLPMSIHIVLVIGSYCMRGNGDRRSSDICNLIGRHADAFGMAVLSLVAMFINLSSFDMARFVTLLPLMYFLCSVVAPALIIASKPKMRQSAMKVLKSSCSLWSVNTVRVFRVNQ